MDSDNVKRDPSSPSSVRMRRRECRLQRSFPFDGILFRSRDIRDQVVKLSEMGPSFDVLVQFWGSLKFLTPKNRVGIEHVLKCGDDRPSDLGN